MRFVPHDILYACIDISISFYPLPWRERAGRGGCANVMIASFDQMSSRFYACYSNILCWNPVRAMTLGLPVDKACHGESGYQWMSLWADTGVRPLPGTVGVANGHRVRLINVVLFPRSEGGPPAIQHLTSFATWVWGESRSGSLWSELKGTRPMAVSSHKQGLFECWNMNGLGFMMVFFRIWWLNPIYCHPV